MSTKKIKFNDLMPVIIETLENGGTFEISIQGTSMLPLLHEGRDTVVLCKSDTDLKKFDIPLYKRKDGAYVLHRVVAVENGTYTMCGDNQWVKEKGIEKSQIIGRVCEIRRNGKVIKTDSFKYKLYYRFWHFLMPVRKYLVKLRGKLKK